MTYFIDFEIEIESNPPHWIRTVWCQPQDRNHGPLMFVVLVSTTNIKLSEQTIPTNIRPTLPLAACVVSLRSRLL